MDGEGGVSEVEKEKRKKRKAYRDKSQKLETECWFEARKKEKLAD